MCAISVIMDYGRNNPIKWNPDNFGAFKSLLRAAEEFDTKADQPHCEDPAKAVWFEEVERQMRDARL